MPAPKLSTPKITSFVRSRRGAMSIAVLAAVLAGGAAWFFMGRTNPQNAFITQEVVMGDVEDTVTAMGTLQPLQFVDVGTQVSGQLRKINVDYGEAVAQGQLLAEIDPTIYESRKGATEASLQNFQAQLTQRQAERLLAQQQFERQKELLAANATSQDAFDSAESRLKVTTAQIAALQAQIRQTESTLKGDTANLSYTKIFAPMAGQVVNLIAKQGQTLNANQTAPLILRIADLDTMTVYAQVSEADVPKLKIGMRAYFTTLGVSEKRRYGTLRQIVPTPEVVNNVVLYNCLFDVENPEKDLLPQMSAQVYFVVSEAHNVPIVSVSALRPAARQPRQAPPADAAKPATPNGTDVAANGTAEAGGAPPAAGERRRMRGQGGRGPGGRTAVDNLHYTVTVLEDGERVQKDITVGAMNRLVAEVKSGLEPGDVVVMEAPAGGGGQQQRPGGGLLGGPGGFGGGVRFR
ncbi:MAG: efflux RND transporter periplasmic adaptor subunit [Rhodospirillaceae bacterium]